MKVHFLIDSGYYDHWVNAPCGLGDTYSRGWSNGTDKWGKVTCKNCLKHKPEN